MRRRNREEKTKYRARSVKQDNVNGANHRPSSVQKHHRQQAAADDFNIFPPFSPWIVCLVTLIVRVNYVTNPENWWILHPDEVFQSLEVAHSEVYGYGFRAYEYLSSTLVEYDSNLREIELNLGMSSMRSFLYPRFYILVSWLANMFSLEISPFLLWKIAHVCMTSLLPIAVYAFTIAFFRRRKLAHDIGVVAAVLTASNAHLTIIGTHTLVNSFVATPVFWSLSVIWEILEPKKENSGSDTKNAENGHCCGRAKKEERAPDIVNRSNGHVVNRNNINEDLSNTSTLNKLLVFLSSGVSLQVINKCFSLKIASHQIRTSQTNDKSGETVTEEIRKMGLQRSGRLLVASFVFILCCYVRVDVAVFSFVTIVMHLSKLSSRSILGLLVCALGSVLALIVAVAEDVFSYKSLVISPYSWLQFNVFRDLSSSVFGHMDYSFYFKQIFVNGKISAGISCSLMLIFLFNLIKMIQSNSHDFKMCWTNTLKLFASLLLLLTLYSTRGHKELRFMHDFLVLLCIFYSAVLLLFIKQALRSSSREVLCICLSLYVLSQWSQFPSSDDTNSFLTFESSRDSQHIVKCMDYLRRQDDVTGVFIDSSVHTAGGYSALHKDVPIISLVHYEFFEFNKEAERNLSSISIFDTKKVRVKTFSQTSNFITLHNTPLLLKQLLLNRQYNYLILGVNRQFIQIGYYEVYRSGTFRILKRRQLPAEEKQLMEIARTIPIGSNATILEYEGSWLVRFKLYGKAAERLATSVNLDSTRVGAFQLLAHSLFKLGQKTEAKNVMAKCVELNGKTNCNSPRERIILHEDYIMK